VTTIEWTDQTWNPVTGCDRVSPGCAHCYALDLAARLKAMGQARYQRDGDPATSGPGFGVTLHPDKLDEPLRWRKPRMVFVNSMSDLFHEEIPDDYIAEVWHRMVWAHQHTFQILTKRPDRMRDWVRAHYPFEQPRNVWLGVSIENRRFVGRADVLRDTPAAVRFISAEPLLGPLLPPIVDGRAEPWPDTDSYWPPYLDLTDIDWLIVGGESGPKHRPMKLDWARDLRDATRCASCAGSGWICAHSGKPAIGGCCGHPSFCPSSNGCRDCHQPGECGGRGYRTAFFFKQHGGRTPKAGGRELDGRTWDEMPGAAA
jgi:protein gp37